MIKYFKFTDNIVSGNVTNTFFQNTNKFQKSVCLWGEVGGGGGRGGRKVLHSPRTTPARYGLDHNRYSHKTYQGCDILQGAPTHEFDWPLNEVVMWGQVAN